jgi:hypothetical protein
MISLLLFSFLDLTEFRPDLSLIIFWLKQTSSVTHTKAESKTGSKTVFYNLSIFYRGPLRVESWDLCPQMTTRQRNLRSYVHVSTRVRAIRAIQDVRALYHAGLR